MSLSFCVIQDRYSLLLKNNNNPEIHIQKVFNKKV
jgi:hypothetical protein